MASGPASNNVFSGYYTLLPSSESNKFGIDARIDESLTVTDLSDGAGDNLSIFGDIQNDGIRTGEQITPSLTFIGNSDRPGEFIAREIGGSQRFLLFSNFAFFPRGVEVNNTGGNYAVVCYADGTRILTSEGNKKVQQLEIGDLVVTANGKHEPIRWIGHRTMACQGRKDVLPVRIAAGAFGEGRPSRDLLVSPAHAICVESDGGEVLIPAIRLVNGTTITQADVETVTYWHVELDSHDILLAEGLPAESYLDCGNRRFFANADVTDLAALPDARPAGLLPFCRPFHEDGPVVEFVRNRLADRARALGWNLVEEAFAGLHLVADGHVIQPDVDGLIAHFVLPADAGNVRLVSETSVPAYVLSGSTDDRRLGVALAAITIGDGSTGTRDIALDDARLREGFYGVDGTARWTNGSAVLPADLWEGGDGSFSLQVTLAAPALARWVAPAGANELAEFRRQA